MKEFELEILDKVAYIASELEARGYVTVIKKTKLGNPINYDVTNIGYSKDEGWVVYFYNSNTNHSCNYFNIEDLDIEEDTNDHISLIYHE